MFSAPKNIQNKTLVLKHTNRSIELEDLGLTPYQVAWEYQKKLVQDRLDNTQLPDKLLLVEHPSG